MLVRKQVKKKGFVLAMVAGFVACAARGEDAPPPEQILEKVRLYQLSQRMDLEGRLRHKNNVVPFRIDVGGGVIRYHLSNPPETLTVRLTESGSSVSGGDLKAPIRGTDVTLEDLSLKFLYWGHVESASEQSVLAGRPCWRLKVYAPSRAESSYGMVMLWVEKEDGAMLRAEAFGWDGKAAKRFEVRSIQRFEGGWLLKQMRIQALEGTRSRDRTPTYLEIEKP